MRVCVCVKILDHVRARRVRARVSAFRLLKTPVAPQGSARLTAAQARSRLRRRREWEWVGGRQAGGIGRGMYKR